MFKKFKILLNLIYPLKAGSYKVCKELVANKSGLEFGGPSKIFSEDGFLPLYPFVKILDNCNFSSKTIWDGEIKSGYFFNFYKGRTGYQYVLDTDELKEIQSEKYDFILASHIIEHLANPIKALIDWKRILKASGTLIVVIPHKDGTFDNRRKVTELEHLIDDYKRDIGENDLTHMDEILTLHDLKADTEAGSVQQFKERSLKNYENRCLHHHVFNTQLAAHLIDFIGFEIVKVEPLLTCHIIVVAKKSEEYDNKKILEKLKMGNFNSPFKSDKIIFK